MNFSFLSKLFPKLRQNSGELLWVAGGQLITVLLNFVSIKLLSRMGTSAYGEYALVLTVSALVSLLYYGPLTQAFIRFYYNYSENSEVFVHTIYRLLKYSPLLLLIIPICSLFFSQLSVTYSLLPLALLTVVFIFFQKTGEFFNSALNIIRARKTNYLLQSLEKLSLVVALWVLFSYGILNLFSALIIITVVALLFTGVKMYRFHRITGIPGAFTLSNTSNQRQTIQKEITLYAAPFVLWGVTGWLQSNAERWLIAGFLGTADVGIYAVTLTLVSALVIFPYNILNEFAIPIIFSRFATGPNTDSAKRGFREIHLVTITVAVGTVISALATIPFGKELIILLSSEEYTTAADLLPLFCAGTGTFYIGQAMCNVGLALNKPSAYLFPKITAGIFALLINYYFIQLYGLQGTAYAGLMTGLFYMVAVLLINKNLLKQKKNALSS